MEVNIEWKGEIGLNDHLINDLHTDSFDMLMIIFADRFFTFCCCCRVRMKTMLLNESPGSSLALRDHLPQIQ